MRICRLGCRNISYKNRWKLYENPQCTSNDQGIRLMKSQPTKNMPKNLLSSANSNSTREKILGPDMLLDCYYVHSTSFKVTTMPCTTTRWHRTRLRFTRRHLSCGSRVLPGLAYSQVRPLRTYVHIT